MVIRKIGVKSAAIITGVLYSLFGIIFGAITSFISIFISSSGMRYSTTSDIYSSIFGAGAIISLPIIYAVLGFVSGALSTWMYNLIIPYTGGLEIEFGDNPLTVPEPLE